MPISQSPLAHSDIQAVMDRALANGRGCRILCNDYGGAHGLRQRFYTVRKLDRKRNKEIYPIEDPRHYQSIYDSLIVYPAGPGEDDPPDAFYCVIEVSSADRLNDRVEDI